MGWVVNATPRPLYPLKRPGTHYIGGWVGPGVGLEECGKSRLLQGFDPRIVQHVAQSLYRLSYPGPQIAELIFFFSPLDCVKYKNVIRQCVCVCVWYSR